MLVSIMSIVTRMATFPDAAPGGHPCQVPNAPLITLARRGHRPELEALTEPITRLEALAFRRRRHSAGCSCPGPPLQWPPGGGAGNAIATRRASGAAPILADGPAGLQGRAMVGTTTATSSSSSATGSRWSPRRRRSLPNGIARRHAGVWMIWWRRAATNLQPRP